MTPHPPRLLATLTTALAFAFALLSTSAHARKQTARLVKDANLGPGDFNANITWVMPLGNKVIFTRNTLKHGSELWISNGTTAGSSLLKDLTPGPGGTIPETPVAFGGKGGVRPQVAFRSLRYSTGNEVWVTDGTTAGSRLLYKNESPGANGETRVQAGTPQGVFFENAGWAANGDYELFFSDGTKKGTRSLNPPGVFPRLFEKPFAHATQGQWCYFIANQNEIWRSNGTVENTTRQMTITAGIPQHLGFIGDRVFVEAWVNNEPSQLWTSIDGEPTRIDLPDEASTPERIGPMVTLGDQLFFFRYDQFLNYQLWISDGTTAGTRRIPLQHGGQGDESHPLGQLRVWKDALYLSAFGADDLHELWRTDGSPAGTSRLASFTAPQDQLQFYDAQATRDFLYFQTSDSEGHFQLWRTQGDASSTIPVRSTESIAISGGWPTLAATDSGNLFFAADYASPDNALWRLREKSGATARLTKPETTSGSSIPALPLNARPHEMHTGNLLQLVNTGSSHELWTVTPDGKDARSIWIMPVPMLEYGNLGFHASTPHGAIFSFSDGVDIRQLWTTDGTSDGTRLLGDFSLDHEDGYPRDFVKVGDVWFFSVINYINPAKSRLWKTDGTPEGTIKVTNASGTSPRPEPGEMVGLDGYLYLIATDQYGSTGIWRTDGNVAGTTLVKGGWYRSLTMPSRLSTAGGELFFIVRDSLWDTLFKSDGTAAGTVSIASTFFSSTLSRVVDLNGAAIFHASNRGTPRIHLFRRDPTGTFTVLRSDISQHVVPWDAATRIQAVAGTQFFYNAMENYDSELWVTDGTDAGTRLVKDINPGVWSSQPSEIISVGNTIYFSARDEEHGYELWRSDGTEAGTTLVADIEPGPDSSEPKDLKVMDGKLYFTAHRRDVGRELFSVDLPQ